MYFNQILKTYAVTKSISDGKYTLYCVHLSNFSEKELQDILDGKSTKYINLGMFSNLESAIDTATKKGFTPLKVVE